MPDDRRFMGTPSTVPELWVHIEAENRATKEWRDSMRETLSNFNTKMNTLDTAIESVNTKVSNEFVRKDYFEAVFQPVKNIVYGMVALILIGVVSLLGSLMYIVVTQQ